MAKASLAEEPHDGGRHHVWSLKRDLESCRSPHLGVAKPPKAPVGRLVEVQAKIWPSGRSLGLCISQKDSVGSG